MGRRGWLVVGTGLVFGFLGVLLVRLGNPGNMGLCVACFIRDIAGALGLHRNSLVQYLRPEIPGLILGAFLAAVLGREFRARGGSGGMVRFLLGFLMMLGALVFLGCPVRMLFRLGGGDLNAVPALAGFVAGVGVGVGFLKRGFNLGRAERESRIGGLLLPAVALALVFLAAFYPVVDPKAGGPLFLSREGPGASSAPFGASLVAGLVLGFLAQRAGFCFAGGIRDFIITRDSYLLWGYGALLGAALVGNLLSGKFHLGFTGQPVAHTAALWNFLGMFLVGLAAVLAGGCPLRHLVLAGEGNTDSALTVLGMVAGAAFGHNFALASSPLGPTPGGKVALLVGIAVALLVGWTCRESC